jgi:hypothetical protein
MDQYRNAELVQQNGWGQLFEKQALIHGSQSFGKLMRETLANKA